MRLVFGTMMAVSVAIMVGAFPVGSEAPLGSLLRWSYESVPALFAFRNVYKAGAGLVVGVAILLAIGAREAVDRVGPGARHYLSVRVVGAVGISAVFVVSGWPLVSGEILRDGLRIDGDVPAHWHDAVDWLDDQDGDGRVLVLPGSASENYRWGGASGGDIFPALLDRPAVFAQPLTGSPVVSADVTAALDRAVTDGRYEPGTLAPIARRLGIQFVVLRNDFDWQGAGVARPARLDAVRADPGLELVATFGAPGDGVTRLDDESAEADDERRLPPVEVYRVPGVDDVVRAVGPGPALLVSGGGAGWTPLARSGALDELGPIRWTAQLTGDDWIRELEQGSSVVITDSNRRRPMPWGQENRTVTVLDDDRIDDMFGDPRTQSVAEFGDAARIRYAGPAGLFDAGAAFRPSAAFDGDPSTMWLTGINGSPNGQRVRIELSGTTVVDEVRVRVAEPVGGRTVTRVAIILPDVEPYTFDVVTGVENVLRFPATSTEVLSVAPLEVAGAGLGPFGFAEVEVPGLDLAERVAMPRDLAVAAESEPDVFALARSAPLTIEMQRLIGDRIDVESALFRRVDIPVERSAELAGSIQITGATSATGVAALVGSPITAEVRPNDAVTSRADVIAALDGDPNTSLALPADQEVSVVVRVDDEDLRELTLRLDTEASTTRSLVVRRAGAAVDVGLRWCGHEYRTIVGGARVAVSADAGACTVTIVWSPADPAADEVVVSLVPIDGERVEGEREPVTVVHAIEVAGVEPSVTFDGAGCRDDLIAIDGAPVEVRVDGTLEDLINGVPMPVEGCDTIGLGGVHEVRVAPGVPVDWLRLTAIDGNSPVPVARVPVTVEQRSSVDHVVTLDGPAGARLILGQAFTEGWTARVGGIDLGRATSLDAQAGWTLPQAGPQRVEITHSTQSAFRWVALLALTVLCLLPAVVVLDPGRRRAVATIPDDADEVVRAQSGSDGDDADHGSRTTDRVLSDLTVVGGVAVAVFAFLVGGWAALIVVAAGMVALERRWVTAAAIGAAATVLVIVAAIVSVPPLGPSLDPVWPLWPSQRGLAHESARLAIVLASLSMWRVVSRGLRRRP